MRQEVERAGLIVSMVTADSDVPLNNEHGPDSLRNIGPTLDVAEALGSDLIRVCLKTPADVEHAQRSADLAAERGIRLAHQCHTTTLFEEVEPSIAWLKRINRRNFGLIYEPINLLICGQSYGLTTLRKFAPYLMNVYVQNHRLDPQGPAALDTWCLGERRFHHIPALGSRRRQLSRGRHRAAGDRLRRLFHRPPGLRRTHGSPRSGREKRRVSPQPGRFRVKCRAWKREGFSSPRESEATGSNRGCRRRGCRPRFCRQIGAVLSRRPPATPLRPLRPDYASARRSAGRHAAVRRR